MIAQEYIQQYIGQFVMEIAVLRAKVDELTKQLNKDEETRGNG